MLRDEQFTELCSMSIEELLEVLLVVTTALNMRINHGIGEETIQKDKEKLVWELEK